MRVSRPVYITLPEYGVLFAESAHAADFRMTERKDPYHKLIYVLDGRVAYRESQRAAPVIGETGSMLIVPRDVPHVIVDEEPSVLLLLCLGGEFLGLDPELGRLWLILTRVPRHCLRMSRPTRQRLEAMWRQAMVEKEHTRIGNSVAVRTLAAQILVLLARLPAEGSGATASERVAAVAREIEETFFDHWDLDRAALRAGISRRHFTNLFREEVGQTFWDFLNERRLKHAAHLLRAGENSVLGVAFSCGFNDVTHFYRLFRRRYGEPPGRWAQQSSKFSPEKAGSSPEIS